jgi:Ran GTPase-activating protein (RanGAP) involved in mRNA processing and transport
MRCLYLGQNILRSIAGLHTMTHLETLDVSENDISHVDNLSCLPKLRTLNIAANKLASAASIAHLTECPSLTSVDLGKNRLEEEGAVAVLQALSGLSLLRLQGNPVVSRVKHYRKAMVAAMPGLKYLDDSPVFDKERRLAVAFSQGGFEVRASFHTPPHPNQHSQS